MELTISFVRNIIFILSLNSLIAFAGENRSMEYQNTLILDKKLNEMKAKEEIDKKKYTAYLKKQKEIQKEIQDRAKKTCKGYKQIK
jgi:hypothetical protein